MVGLLYRKVCHASLGGVLHHGGDVFIRLDVWSIEYHVSVKHHIVTEYLLRGYCVSLVLRASRSWWYGLRASLYGAATPRSERLNKMEKALLMAGKVLDKEKLGMLTITVHEAKRLVAADVCYWLTSWGTYPKAHHSHTCAHCRRAARVIRMLCSRSRT
jgi:hypothetical protein